MANICGVNFGKHHACKFCLNALPRNLQPLGGLTEAIPMKVAT